MVGESRARISEWGSSHVACAKWLEARSVEPAELPSGARLVSPSAGEHLCPELVASPENRHSLARESDFFWSCPC